MEFVTINGIDLVYGVQWNSLDGIGSIEDQAKSIARKNGYGAYCVATANQKGGETIVGGIKPRVGGKLVISSAVAFAAEVEVEFAAYLGQLASGKFVLIGLLNGIPSPSFDIIGEADKIVKGLEEFEPHLAQGALLYFQNSVLDASQEIANKVQECAPSTVLRVVSDMPMRMPDDEDTVRFRDLGMHKGLKFGGLLFVALAVIAGGLYGYDYYTTQHEKMAAANDKSAAALQGYIASRDSAFQSEQTHEVLAASEFIWSQLKNQLINRAGWVIKSTDCTGPQCTLVYSRSRKATFDNFVKSAGQGETPVVLLADLETATMVVAMPAFEKVPLFNLTDFKQPENHNVDFGTRAQVMALAGITLSFTQETVLGDPNFVKDLPKGSTVVRRSGKWTATGPADTFVPVMRRLPLNITLSSVHFDVNTESVRFQAAGRYFLQ
ncbi:hypothetical protein Rfer_4247 (plasmid) [Rhodoferax ferrireducens T118]|uniref:Uncharacterized protein n=1 Tax=Albidiferax ferrireducens (strain ATCC BAA-621 / DSM 15236 / T118) TaxID=338969 RepID=Q21QL1_ALBFT|nr:type 4b pilus protein PilO2 [Rhodoferax ferrireducens]ABD71934.1 hypothetical protein Rfer_4247 [Rhodoferax ferrireducens T118]